MRRRNPLIYLIAVLIVGAIVWLIEKPYQPRQGSVAEISLFENFNVQNVDRIEIEHLLNAVELKREGISWKLSESESAMKKQLNEQDAKEGLSNKTPEKVSSDADNEKVTRLLNTIRDLKVKTLVSENPEKQAVMYIGAAGMQIRTYDSGGTILSELIVGKNAPDIMSTYVKKGNENKVYLVNPATFGGGVNELLGNQFAPTVDNWKIKEAPAPL